MANAVAVSDSPVKGSRPVPANAIVAPQDHMSAAAVTRSPASCSGAMNAGAEPPHGAGDRLGDHASGRGI